MPSLYRTLALTQVNTLAIFIRHHLNFDVARTLDKFLEIDIAILEGSRGFSRGRFQSMPQFLFRVHDAHAAAAAARRSFNDHRKTYLARPLDRVRFGLHRLWTAGKNRNSRGLHGAAGFNFLSHQPNDFRARTDEFDVAGFANLREVSGFSQKPVAGMNSVHIKNLGGANNRGNVQITLGRRCGADAGSLVSETHVKRVAIHVAVHGDRADAHLFAGPDDSAGNLAAIGNQDFAEGSRAVVHKIVDFRLLIADWHFEINTFRPIDTRQSKIANGLCLDSEEGLTVFNGLTVFDVDLHDLTAGLSLNLVHQFHGLDNAYDGVGFDVAADANEALRCRGRRAIESANDG